MRNGIIPVNVLRSRNFIPVFKKGKYIKNYNEKAFFTIAPRRIGIFLSFSIGIQDKQRATLTNPIISAVDSACVSTSLVILCN
jgi:hypothetical protein